MLDEDGASNRYLGDASLSRGSPAWSPTGRWLAMREGPVSFENIVTVDPQSEERRIVTSDPWGRHDWPTWSPDGGSIAYVEMGVSPTHEHMGVYARGADIHVVDLADLSVRQLTSSRGFDGMPAWSPRLGPKAGE